MSWPRIVWSLRSQCIALAIAPVFVWLGVLEYRHQQKSSIIREMNRAAWTDTTSLDVESRISILEIHVEMTLETPELHEWERRAELSFLNRSLATAYRLREQGLADRDQYSCAVSR